MNEKNPFIIIINFLLLLLFLQVNNLCQQGFHFLYWTLVIMSIITSVASRLFIVKIHPTHLDRMKCFFSVRLAVACSSCKGWKYIVEEMDPLSERSTAWVGAVPSPCVSGEHDGDWGTSHRRWNFFFGSCKLTTVTQQGLFYFLPCTQHCWSLLMSTLLQLWLHCAFVFLLHVSCQMVECKHLTMFTKGNMCCLTFERKPKVVSRQVSCMIKRRWIFLSLFPG